MFSWAHALVVIKASNADESISFIIDVIIVLYCSSCILSLICKITENSRNTKKNKQLFLVIFCWLAEMPTSWCLRLRYGSKLKYSLHSSQLFTSLHPLFPFFSLFWSSIVASIGRLWCLVLFVYGCQVEGDRCSEVKRCEEWRTSFHFSIWLKYRMLKLMCEEVKT